LDLASEDGDFYYVTGCYAQDWLFHLTDFNWRVDAVDGGELRAVADIGTPTILVATTRSFLTRSSSYSAGSTAPSPQ
jgi:hypothetical protein